MALNLIIGKSRAVSELRGLISQAATSDAGVLILGESGTGKELVARALHTGSSRSSQQFVPVNCGAIPKELLESELFGHKKGAFTGAISDRTGRFELANNGTLFLDEIGDMPLEMQVKLLRVLQEGTVDPVGSTKPVAVNVRVVAATHRDLDRYIDRGDFREDLFYRLNVIPIILPALRERREDIPELIQYYLKKHARVDGGMPIFDGSLIDALCDYDWPGNIREVRNVIERSLIFFPNQPVSGEDVNQYLISVNNSVITRAEEQTAIWTEFDELGDAPVSFDEKEERTLPTPEDFSNWFDTNNSVDLRLLLRDIEIVFIEAALNRNNGNTSEAAKDLKLLRTTLIEKVKKYGL